MSNQHYWQQANPQPPYQQQQPAYGHGYTHQPYPGQVPDPHAPSGYAPPASYGGAAGYPHAQQYHGAGAAAPAAPAVPQYGMSTTSPAPGNYQYSAAPPPSSFASQPGYGGASSYPAGPPHSAYQSNNLNAFPQQQQQHQQPPPPPQFNPVLPPSQAGPPVYLGTRLARDPLQPHVPIPLSLPGYDPAGDVEIIRKATKGFGTDENALNRVICLRTADQLQVLAQAYKSRYGKDLVELIKKETSGYYEQTLCLLLSGPLEGDVTLLHEAIAGAGTKETMVTEILVGRHPNELILLRACKRGG